MSKIIKLFILIIVIVNQISSIIVAADKKPLNQISSTTAEKQLPLEQKNQIINILHANQLPEKNPTYYKKLLNLLPISFNENIINQEKDLEHIDFSLSTPGDKEAETLHAIWIKQGLNSDTPLQKAIMELDDEEVEKQLNENNINEINIFYLKFLISKNDALARNILSLILNQGIGLTPELVEFSEKFSSEKTKKLLNDFIEKRNKLIKEGLDKGLGIPELQNICIDYL